MSGGERSGVPPPQPAGRGRSPLHQGRDRRRPPPGGPLPAGVRHRHPTGQLLLHLTPAIAEWEWSNVRQRSIQGQERARAEGERIGRPPALTPEARQAVERKLREGQSVTRIAQVHRVHHSVIRRVAREVEATEQ